MKKFIKRFSHFLMKRKTFIDTIKILGQCTNEKGTLTITKDLHFKDAFGMSFVRGKYAKKEKYTKQDMLILKRPALVSFLDWILEIEPDKDADIRIIRCDCHSELIDLYYDKDFKEIVIEYWDNYFLKKWGLRKYLIEYYDNVEVLKKFAKEIKEKIKEN